MESNERFAPHTVISPAAIPGHEPTIINIGHVDELHYVSTIPCNEEMVETNLNNVIEFIVSVFYWQCYVSVFVH